jgi:hypothetical protein
MPSKQQKKMAKEIRVERGRYLSSEARQYGDELTRKEMLKKFPKRESEKKEKNLISQSKKISIKKSIQHKTRSKRTTPGLIDTRDSSPAHTHPEGKRWMNTLIKQAQNKRTIQEHKGLTVSRKK